MTSIEQLKNIMRNGNFTNEDIKAITDAVEDKLEDRDYGEAELIDVAREYFHIMPSQQQL